MRQPETRGIGHAIWCARNHIGDEPFVVLLGDDVIFSDTPCTKQLLQRHQKYRASVVAVEEVPLERIPNYGIIDPATELEEGFFSVAGMMEKPQPHEAPSDLGILGRYVLTADVFEAIEQTAPGAGGEIQLTDALQRLLPAQAIYASRFEGQRFDLGDKLEWLKTHIAVAMRQPELRPSLAAFMRGLDLHDVPPALMEASRPRERRHA